MPSGVVLFCLPAYWFGVVVGRLNSECSQQNRANENEYGAHREYIQLQGKVHGRCLPC
jgi:hypothetical protein